MELSVKQMECIDFCLEKSRRLVAVTGEAGTGKTTLIKHLTQILDKEGIPYAVAAPTGKAAKRIKEATGVPATTIHKLLEYGRPGERDEKTGKPVDTTSPKRGREAPLDHLITIVDEYSMVNQELNRNLIDALPRGGRLIMFGDISQLQPIEQYVIKNAKGSPFMEHLERPNCAYHLTEVFRQKEGSDVLNAAHKIKSGLLPLRAPNFVMRITDDPVNNLCNHVLEALDNGIDYADVSNQILTPLKVRWIGTQALNTMLKSVLNPDAENELNLPRHKWEEKNPLSVGVGDKVVCTENTYDMRDYDLRFTEWTDMGAPIVSSFIPTPENKMMLNGETGVVVATYPDGSMEIDFGDRVVEVPATYAEYWQKNDSIIDVYPGRSIDLAYALTTHKAQGSEYKHVTYVMNSSAFYVLCRENLYTGVTRARDSVTLVTDQKGLLSSIRTTQAELERRRERQAATRKTMVK